MESSDELKKISIVPVIISATIKIEEFDFDNILLDETSHENILIYDFLYKTLIGAKLLHIRFDKVDGFIRVYDGTRYLKFDVIYNKNKISYKSKEWYCICHFS